MGLEKVTKKNLVYFPLILAALSMAIIYNVTEAFAGKEAGYSHSQFIIKLKEGYTVEDIKEFNSKKNVEISEK